MNSWLFICPDTFKIVLSGFQLMCHEHNIVFFSNYMLGIAIKHARAKTYTQYLDCKSKFMQDLMIKY